MNVGTQIWEKLLYPSSNIRLLICGHTGNGNSKYEDNVGYRIDNNTSGKPIHQMMFNVQFWEAVRKEMVVTDGSVYWNSCLMGKRLRSGPIRRCSEYRH